MYCNSDRLQLATANMKSDIDDDERIVADIPIIQLLITLFRDKLDWLVKWPVQVCFVQQPTIISTSLRCKIRNNTVRQRKPKQPTAHLCSTVLDWKGVRHD